MPALLHFRKPRPPRLTADLLHGAFEEAVVGMVLCWPDAAGITVNRAFCQFIGYTRQELAALDPCSLPAPEEHDADEAMRTGLLNGKFVSHRREKRFIHKDGSLLWADFSCTLVRDRHGRPDYFLAQVVDITERKRVQRELLHSQERFKSLCDLTSDWYWEQDAEFRFVRAFLSPAAPPDMAHKISALVGLRRWEVPGMQALSCSWEEHRATVEGHRPYRNFEFGLREGADWLVFSSSGEPVFAEDGRFAGYRGTSRDITAAKRAELELDGLNQKLEERVRERTRALEQANRELEAFAYSIAHDLRAPMTAVGGFSRVLQQRLQPSDGTGQHYLERILGNVQRMSELTDALLSLASLSGADIEHEPLDLTELARAAAAELVEAGAAPPEALRIQGGLRASGSPQLMRQVIANLLANACKFAARQAVPRIEVGGLPADMGSASASASLSAPAAQPGLRTFYVRDNGVGFDMQYAADLFLPFRRLHAERDFPGTGIGLAVVRKIVERHGGTVWAEAVPGEGATFYFSLPRDGDDGATIPGP